MYWEGNNIVNGIVVLHQHFECLLESLSKCVKINQILVLAQFSASVKGLYKRAKKLTIVEWRVKKGQRT